MRREKGYQSLGHNGLGNNAPLRGEAATNENDEQRAYAYDTFATMLPNNCTASSVLRPKSPRSLDTSTHSNDLIQGILVSIEVN